MKLSVVSDHQGKILSLFPAPAETEKSAPPARAKGQKRGKLTYVPQPGEQVHVLEVPSSFYHKPLHDIHAMLRVEMHGNTAKLVEVKAD